MRQWISLALTCLFLGQAHAGEAEDLIEAFTAEATRLGGDVTPFCSEAFLKRESMGCTGLSSALASMEVEAGRVSIGDDELLAEFWMMTPGGRFPLYLLARSSSAGWQFVDGTDGDGPRLDTSLSLDDSKPTGGVVLPKGLARVIDELNRDHPKLKKLCDPSFGDDECSRLVGLLRDTESDFVPTDTRHVGDNVFVTGVLSGPDRGTLGPWLKFVPARKGWRLAGVEEPPL